MRNQLWKLEAFVKRRKPWLVVPVCFALMFSGHLILTMFGVNGITILPLFLGGMLYAKFADL